MKCRRREKCFRCIILKISLFLLTIIFLYPIVVTLTTSFYGKEGISLVLYKELLLEYFPFYTMFWNSVIYSSAITAIGILLTIPAAFSFQFAEFKGKQLLFILYITLMMMPLQVTLLPNYIGLREMHLINTRYTIILPAIFAPFGVVVMRQYMNGINQEVIEAVRLETSSILRIITTAVIPQVKICIRAVMLFVFVDAWSMIEQPLLFLKDDKLKTLPILYDKSMGLSTIITIPAAVFFMIPGLIFYANFNEDLEHGLTMGTYLMKG